MISLTAQTAKIVVKVLKRRIKRKIKDNLENISLDLEKDKELQM